MDPRLIIRSETIAISVSIKLPCYELLNKDGGEKLFNRKKNHRVKLVLRQCAQINGLG